MEARMTTLFSPLHQLFQDHWDAWMRFDPIFATFVGENRYNDCLPDGTDDSYQLWREKLVHFQKILGRIDRATLTDADRLNYDLFNHLVTNEIAELGFNAHRLPISRCAGFHTSFPDLFQNTPFDSEQDYDNYISRLYDFKRFTEANIDLMRLGLGTGYIPPRCTLTDVDQQLQAQMVSDPGASVLFRPFTSLQESKNSSLSKRVIQVLCEEARKAIQTSVVAGYAALLEFLNQEYLPAARESIACADIPDGEAFYTHRIYYFTSLKLSAAEVHQTGLEEVRRIRAEMDEVICKTGWKGDMVGFLEFLRTDPRFYVTTPDALLEKTSLVLKRMDGELPRLFKTLPRMPYGIRQVPEYSAAGETAGYYNPGLGDGTRAGMYYVNTYDLASRPLYEIEALSLHEAVPGHHLQLALQAVLADLPMFRRYTGYTSYVEGWALYSERLGLEVGFYTDPYSDFGRLSYEMWRACRLVVDTGMHVLGWSRQQAIDHLVENTSSTLLNIINEIDRYIAWPGQALAYKLGELKISQLRRQAEVALGNQFNLREFHDVVLLSGAVPMDVLENRVNQWIEGQSR
jgi:uncharacterized protein (DUF885 family)